MEYYLKVTDIGIVIQIGYGFLYLHGISMDNWLTQVVTKGKHKILSCYVFKGSKLSL